MHVAQRGSNQLTSFRIGASDGSLPPLGTIPLGSDPCYLGMDRTGRFLLGAYYLAEKASVHRIGADGAAQDPPIEWRTTGRGAHCFQTDRANRFAFVPHIEGNGAPNAIFQFRFDAETGQLAPNAPDRFTAAEMLGPRHFCFHPNQKFIYTANEDSSTVSAYHFDNAKGTLGAFQTVSTLPPEGYVPGEEPNSCAQIRITPNGQFLYAPNRGHNSVACFRVAESGSLSTIGYTPIERHTRGTAMDPEGRFYYTTGTRSGRMASFAISQQTGALEPLENFAIGEAPMWVEIVTQP